MTTRDEYLQDLIEHISNINVNGSKRSKITAYRQKCDEGFIPYAESQVPYIHPGSRDEADADTISLRSDAITLREYCDSLLRSTAADISESEQARVTDLYLNLCARLENIVLLRRPDLLGPLDEVMLGANP